MTHRSGNFLDRSHGILRDVFHRIDGLLDGALEPLCKEITFSGFHEFCDRFRLSDTAGDLWNTNGGKGAKISIYFKMSKIAIRGNLFTNSVMGTFEQIRR